MRTSENITNIAASLALAQSEIEPAVFDSNNPDYNSRYASLASVMRACRNALSKNQIAVVQGSSVSEKNVVVNTMLIHASGDYIADDLSIPISQNTPQAIGSALTYGRRYGLASLVGIVCEEDDDAESAMPKSDDNGGFDNVEYTAPKESVRQAPGKASTVKEVKTPRESKSKRAIARAALIKEIFNTSNQLGMNITNLKEFISNLTGKSIAESGDLSDADLPFILGELQKLKDTESKAA